MLKLPTIATLMRVYIFRKNYILVPSELYVECFFFVFYYRRKVKRHRTTLVCKRPK